ncbi:sulfotransferase family protein [Nitzschia inconspicua]|uniref:Sulfotransferase family protein n=1 Tax=Nitzschia inconspicua TaxID=303405 RepID=A0A9K3PYN6_9STRA|nr:sulfotransferase family protein [Nitzschia inconspicua]
MVVPLDNIHKGYPRRNISNVCGHHFRYILFVAVTVVVSYQTVCRDIFFRSTFPLCAEQSRIAKVVDHVEPVMTVQSTAKVVWLMSFPNSGTSFTLRLINELSNTATATNYGEELQNMKIPLIQLNTEENAQVGPFLLQLFQQIPNYIITKTHCWGYNTRAPPKRYIDLKEKMFEKGCRSVTYPTPDANYVMADTRLYNMTVPKKAIHIVRNPFDNLVSRWHLWKNDYENTTHSFADFCHFWDTTNEERGERQFLSQETYNLMKDLPCRSDWYRYVQWHNLAIRLIEKHRLPALSINYEDYESKYGQIIQQLLDFLELPKLHDPPPFKEGKSYMYEYTPEDQQKAKKFVRHLASEQTWSLIKRYFESIP